MEFLLSSFFIFSTQFFSLNYTSAPPLLSLWCNPPPSSSNPTNDRYPNINPIKNLLDNLSMEAPTTLLTTSNITFSFRQEHYTALMQCRPGLGPENCTLCTQAARNTISNLCRNSNAVSAWFDGCYVQISTSSYPGNAYENMINRSCSGPDYDQDPARHVPALGALLLKLRADVNIFTHHGFSHGDIAYENSYRGESKIFGLVECVRSLSPEECDSCIEKAVEEILFYCSGKNGGTLVHGMCLVRFDSSEFYRAGVDSWGPTSNFTFLEGENGDGGKKKKLVMEYWSGGFACFLVLLFFVWLLRRVLNRGKVGTSGSEEAEGKSGD